MEGVYQIAGVNFKIKYKYLYTAKMFEKYTANDCSHIEIIELDDKDYDFECKKSPNIPVEYLETLAIQRKLLKVLLLKYDAIFFHGSAVSYKGKAFMFTAPSGTGKSTHTALLKELLGDELLYINDDKPIIRVVDGAVNVFGSPWNGKHFLGDNISANLEAICVVTRASENKIVRLSPVIALKSLFEQTVEYDDEKSAEKLLEVISEIVSSTKFYTLYCNKELDAAKCSFSGMISNSYED